MKGMISVIKVAIVGFGNIGNAVYQAITQAPDVELAGVVRRGAVKIAGLEQLTVVDDIEKLGKVDVAILCAPSRLVPQMAKDLLSKGICCVDSYDIHTDIYEVKAGLDAVCKQSGARAIISAGWDPGSDSIVRALFKAMAPKGITYTNFGPGMSMGHTVAVKAIKGVKNALSMTIPKGTSIHRRMVYVEIEPGCDFEQIKTAITQDAYFKHDETHVTLVESVDQLLDVGHGTNITRKGVSGTTGNQLFEFNMKINNPALTAQVLVASARAAMLQKPGAYTMIEVPVIDFLYGDREQLIRELV